ncbi:MAG: recombinase family protein [Clostridiales bacterium]|nr:recombinase family protein [Clostridiales bacterium]
MGKRQPRSYCRFARADGAPIEKRAETATRIAGSEGRKAGKTVLYCRAANGGMDAIDLQLKRLRSYAELNGYSACAAAWDCNASGVSMERPALQKLLSDVRSGDVGRVIACDTARLARDTIRFHELASLFADCGAELITVADGRLVPPTAEMETLRKALEEACRA